MNMEGILALTGWGGLRWVGPVELFERGPVWLRDWAVGWLPEGAKVWAEGLIPAVAVLAVFGLLFGLATVAERKLLGRIQNRPGPNRVGPYGWLQFAADGVKMLTKEDVVPRSADRVLHFLAPIVMLAPVALSLAVIPYGRDLVAADPRCGLLFFFAVGSAAEVAAFMAGWSSRNKYSLLGAMRAIAQMISYELPLVLSALTVVMMAGSLSLVEIVEAQSGYWWGVIPRWHVMTPWGLAGLLLFMAAAAAASNRAPFDLPEGESEIIGGFMTEYSGFKYAIFFMGEYFGMFAVSGLAVTLFLGGWQAPLAVLEAAPSYGWFFLKLGVMIAWFIWVRGTLPRLRVDHLLNFGWKYLLPLGALNLLVAMVWRG
ncbi:MAG TPA: NADH-quinone oxidoreductase subunit NuoH, partial [Candidatus Paceibacterota bacterium]|nr:NADH-quinone oxidoreductase subunit NuoH [Candidatus Paceibacterota bacterium]